MSGSCLCIKQLYQIQIFTHFETIFVTEYVKIPIRNAVYKIMKKKAHQQKKILKKRKIVI